MANVTMTANTEINGVQTFGFLQKPIIEAPDNPWMGWSRYTNVTYRKFKLLMHNSLRNIIQADNGGCGWNPKGNMDIYDRTLEIHGQKVELELCAKDFNCTELEELLNTGVRKADITGTQIARMVINLAMQGQKYDLWLGSWFGERGAAREYANTMDGIWTYVKELVDGDYIPYVDSNSGSALDTDDIIELLKNVKTNAADVLDSCPINDRVMYVNRDVYEALECAYSTDPKCCTEITQRQLQNGLTSLSFMGITLEKVSVWNDFFRLEGLTNQNYVLYTVRNNLAIGTNRESDMSTIDVWYEKKEQKNCLRAEFEFGTNFVHTELLSVAY